MPIERINAGRQSGTGMRWPRRVIGCFVLGLATSIAVAWAACVWAGGSTTGAWYTTDRTQPMRKCMCWSWWGGDDGREWRDSIGVLQGAWSGVPDLRTIELPRSLGWDHFDLSLDSHQVIRAGWPLRCLESERRKELSSETGTRAWSLRIRDTDIGDEWLEGTVPLRPLPIGLLVNTAVFGSAWLALYSVLIAAGPAARRRRRAGKGLCAHCGYDLRGVVDKRCPECGVNRHSDDPPEQSTGIRQQMSEAR